MSECLSGATAPSFDLAAAQAQFLAPLPRWRRRVGARRFDRFGGELVRQLQSLYGDRTDFSAWVISLFSELGRLAAARPNPLARLDLKREATPDWFVRRRMAGYSAYVDRFGGDLAGVAGRIDYLRELGIDYLYLLPFLRARRGDNDGGFAVASFDEVEPALGNMAQLELLTAKLRAAGISLCADLVLNHVADEHAWAQAAASGDPAMRAFFHVFPDRREPDAYEACLGEVFPLAAPGNFSHVPAMGGWVWTTFYPFQWDLNYAHPPVFAAMTQALLRLANRGVEIFRLDSAPYLWKRLGTACINEPEVHRILAALRCGVQLVAPGVLLKAEAIVPTGQATGYFGRGALAGKECQLAYHSGLMASAWAALAEGNAELPRQLLLQTPPLPADTGWVTYVRCHDDIVWNVLRPLVRSNGGDFEQRIGKVVAFLEGRTPGSFARGAAFQSSNDNALHGTNGMTASLLGLGELPSGLIDPAALRRYVLLHALALWVGAVPLIYMGDELGQGNNTDPADAVRVARDGRWLQRPRLSSRAFHALTDDKGLPAATFAALRGLIALRRHARWPDVQTVTVVPAAEAGLLLLRRGDDAIGIFHFGHAEATLDLCALDPGGRWSDLLCSGAVQRNGSLTLQPWATLWRVREHE